MKLITLKTQTHIDDQLNLAQGFISTIEFSNCIDLHRKQLKQQLQHMLKIIFISQNITEIYIKAPFHTHGFKSFRKGSIIPTKSQKPRNSRGGANKNSQALHLTRSNVSPNYDNHEF